MTSKVYQGSAET